MKTLIVSAVLSLVSMSASASRLSCSFQTGSILRPNGEYVARTFSPRVLSNVRQLDLDIRGEQVVVYSWMDINVNRLGAMTCAEEELREGFDCFRVYTSQPGQREFLLHVSQQQPWTATLEMGLGNVTGTIQNDQYVCRL